MTECPGTVGWVITLSRQLWPVSVSVAERTPKIVLHLLFGGIVDDLSGVGIPAIVGPKQAFNGAP
jgi:hypothetical protein